MEPKDSTAESFNSLPTVVETKSFINNAERLLSRAALEELRAAVAQNPTNGVIIPGSGGVRKMRLALGNRGKRDGARIIYYYNPVTGRVYMLAIYAKNEKINLRQAEINAMKALVKRL